MKSLTAIIFLFLIIACGDNPTGPADPPKPVIGDTTPPSVVSITPPDNATGVGISTEVVVVFSERIDPESASNGLQVYRANGRRVNGFIKADSNFISFTPDSTDACFNTVRVFGYETTYTARVTTNVKDLVGNRLTKEFVWSFTTEDIPPWLFVDMDFSPALLAAGDDGSIYAAGTIGAYTPYCNGGTTSDVDVFTAKFGPSGNLEWIVRRELDDGLGGNMGFIIHDSHLYFGYRLINSGERIEKLTTDGESIWYVPVGPTYDLTIQNNALYGHAGRRVGKVNLDGVAQQEIRFGFPWSVAGVAGAIGNIYIGGTVQEAINRNPECLDLFIGRFDADLNATGYLEHGANDGKRQCGGGIAALETHDIIYLWGTSVIEKDNGELIGELFVAAYSLEGSFRWETVVDTTALRSIVNRFSSVSATGPDGEIYLTLQIRNRVLRIDKDGTIKWQTEYPIHEFASGVAIAVSGNMVFLSNGGPQLFRFNRETGVIQ